MGALPTCVGDILMDGLIQQFGIDVMQRARLLDATMDGMTVFELDIGHEYSNANGMNHGLSTGLFMSSG